MGVKNPREAVELVKQKHAKFVDLRFTDTRGKEQHLTITQDAVDEKLFDEGRIIDGSSIAGWQDISCSDMIILPDVETAVMDPFYQERTLVMRCNVIDPDTMQGYERDPRVAALRAEQYLKSTGIADHAFFGPEPEFFILDDVKWRLDSSEVSFKIDSREAAWNSATHYEEGNLGHRPRVKGGYFPVPPVDSSQNLRSAMALILQNMGLSVEVHHHEVATGNQNEIGTAYHSLVKKADELQILKYVVHNVAHAYGKTATFMPKPLVGDNGNGMHMHVSLAKDGENLFVGDEYSGLSKTAMHFMGGVLQHSQALNAFTNPTTNSFKRLVPGFEAPVMLAYSARNRSAAIRVPFTKTPKHKRIEIRYPDPAANPYLSFAAILMAGIDGIKKETHPGEAMEKNLYKLSDEECTKIPRLCTSLRQALDALQDDHEFLTQGDVFTQDLIEGFVGLKMEDVKRLWSTTHPVEFDMYYSV